MGFKYRGIDLSQLVGLTVTQRMDELLEIMPARVRRKFKKGVKPAQLALLKKLLKKKKECKEIDGVMQKPTTVRTHLRTMVIVPEMVGSVVGVYSGEFSISYKPVKHGRPGIGATNSSRF